MKIETQTPLDPSAQLLLDDWNQKIESYQTVNFSHQLLRNSEYRVEAKYCKTFYGKLTIYRALKPLQQ